VRAKAETGKSEDAAINPVRQRLAALLSAVEGISRHPDNRPELIGLLHQGGECL
jgi:hypothetical protein